MKKIALFTIIIIFFGLTACNTGPKKIDNEPQICFQLRYMSYYNKSNHDKSVLVPLIHECVNQCRKQFEKEQENKYCSKKQ